MANVESVINWFQQRKGKVTYSMTNRLGPNSYDCSSAVYFALIEGGFLPTGTAIGNTESLYRLEGSLLTPIARSDAQRGDIFVSGAKGGSGGANGHTGVFVSNSNIIHCTAGSVNGIAETAASSGWLGGPPTYYYRLKNAENNNDENKGRETTMQCIYWRPTANGRNGYYFDGTNAKYLAHGDEIVILKRIYKDNNGKDMPEYFFDGNLPWYTRLEQISGQKPVAGILG
ncbi:peptidoglycan amidohydrolase family protein [Enterococcus sp. LJL90]